MKIRDIFYNVNAFLSSLRKSGSSTLLKKIAEENDVWVLVPTEKMKEEFGDKGLTFDKLHQIKGFYPKPVLIDNYTLLKLSELGYLEIDELTTAIENRNSLIRLIKTEIKKFEIINPSFK